MLHDFGEGMGYMCTWGVTMAMHILGMSFYDNAHLRDYHGTGGVALYCVLAHHPAVQFMAVFMSAGNPKGVMCSSWQCLCLQAILKG